MKIERPRLSCVHEPEKYRPDATVSDYLLAFGPLVILLALALSECA